MTGAREHYFTILSCVALVAHLVLNFSVLANRSAAVVLKGFRECRLFMFGLLAYYLTDSVWSVFSKLKMSRLLYGDTVLYFLALAYSLIAWCRYVVVHQEIDGWRRNLLNGLGMLLMAFFIVALTVNCFNGCIFSFTEAGVYVAGPLRDLAFALLSAFALFSSVLMLDKVLRRRDARRWSCLNDIAIGLVMTLACILQTLNPLSPILAIGFLVGSSFLHDFVSEEKNEEERREIEGIREKANSYEAALSLAEIEQNRAQRERCVAMTLERLLTTKDLLSSIRRILVRWCEVMGAQWCYVGRWDGARFRIYQSYTAPGEKPLYDLGAVIDDRAFLSDVEDIREADASVEIPDFQSHPLFPDFVRTSSHPETMRSVASCFSQVIRLDGHLWGTVWVNFRERRELSRLDEQFLRELARCIQLALIGDLYRTRIEDERDRAVAAERSKSLFFSSVSHDIRTPLNAIVGFSELLKQGVADAAERESYVNTILSSSKMLARLINDILDLAKLEDGRMEIIPEPTDVVAIIHEVVEAFGVARAQKSIDLVVETMEMPQVILDPHRIRQILYNFLSNAFKYTDKGRITVKNEWHEDRLVLSVADTGRGISPENQTRILQPFVQVVDRNHRDGTGLGLPICQRLVQAMDGELTIDSTLGKGSTFSVILYDLKVAEKPAANLEEKGESENPVALSRASKVLIVDDSTVNVVLLKSVLTQYGVKDVVAAANGKIALEILRNDDSFDLVLSDLWMPEMDGETLVKAIRMDLKRVNLPVYLVTADVEATHSYASMGFTGILLKPVSIARVQALFKK